MPRYLETSKAIDYLSASAPRAWVKTMLQGMLCSGQIRALAQKGKVEANYFIPTLLSNAATPEKSHEYVIQNLNEFFPVGLARAIADSKSGRVTQNIFEWGEPFGAAVQVQRGLFIYAEDIDLEQGTLRSFFDSGDLNERFFYGDETTMLHPNYPGARIICEIEHLLINADVLEMLQPNIHLPDAGAVEVAAAKTGRPRKWNWDDALAHMVSLANKPDGLSTGPGAQAQIERLMAEWFQRTAGDVPADSQIRLYAAKVMAALKKPKSP